MIGQFAGRILLHDPLDFKSLINIFVTIFLQVSHFLHEKWTCATVKFCRFHYGNDSWSATVCWTANKDWFVISIFDAHQYFVAVECCAWLEQISFPVRLINLRDTINFLLSSFFRIFSVSYGSSFFPVDLWPKREARGPQTNGKASVRNLKYGCWAWLARRIYWLYGGRVILNEYDSWHKLRNQFYLTALTLSPRLP